MFGQFRNFQNLIKNKYLVLVDYGFSNLWTIGAGITFPYVCSATVISSIDSGGKLWHAKLYCFISVYLWPISVPALIYIRRNESVSVIARLGLSDKGKD